MIISVKDRLYEQYSKTAYGMDVLEAYADYCSGFDDAIDAVAKVLLKHGISINVIREVYRLIENEGD